MEVKKPTTFDEQLNKLEKRGCFIGDKTYAKQVLERINYYRLTAYFLPYTNNKGNYKANTTFNKVHRTYLFDNKLRSMLFSVIEEIELYLRTQFAYYHAHKYGALGYMNSENYNNFHNHNAFLQQIQKLISKNKNQPFVNHHIENYNSQFPIWVIIELFTTNDLSIFYSDMPVADQKVLALNTFGTTYKNLSSWLHCLTLLRNYCAHYSRLYYTLFSAQPLTPLKFSYKLWKQVFDYILVLKFLYPTPERWIPSVITPLKALLDEYNDCIELKHIGFPDNWENILREETPKIKNPKNSNSNDPK